MMSGSTHSTTQVPEADSRAAAQGRRYGGLLQQLALKTREIRRWLARAIEPVGFERDPWWDIPINLGLQGATQLRSKLSIGEREYLSLPGYQASDPRAYIIYAALDEVVKAATYLGRVREYLDGPDVSHDEDIVSRLIFRRVLEEHSVRERRLLETLVLVILFSSTDEDRYYRDYLLHDLLDDLVSENSNRREFYGASNIRIDLVLAAGVNEIRSLEQHIDFTRAWYRMNKKPIPDSHHLRLGRLLSSMKERVRCALPLMAEREKLVFGFTYAGYSNASRVIHFSPKSDGRQYGGGVERRGVLSIGLLNLCIIKRCHALLGCPQVPVVDRIVRILELPSPSTVMLDEHKGLKYEVGSLVLAKGRLGAVMEVRTSKYGYSSCLVRYVGPPPGEELREDWYPGYMLQFACGKDGGPSAASTPKHHR